MDVIIYIGIWFATALVSWVIWMFIWKHFHQEPYCWDKNVLWSVGISACLAGSGIWPVAIPVFCLTGIGYLLYCLIIKD